MKKGNWVPISKGLTKELPKNRPFSEVEAAFSLQVDYDNQNPVTVNRYCELWKWSRNKVYRFFRDYGIRIEYPEDTAKRQNQKGLITIQKPDGKGAETGLKRLIDSRWLDGERDGKGTDKGQKPDRNRYTTKDPNPDPNKTTGEPLLKIPLQNGFFDVYQSDVNQWSDTFPGIDVLQILKHIRQWNIDNPQKRKTPRGIRQHISTWLKKESEAIPAATHRPVEQEPLEDVLS